MLILIRLAFGALVPLGIFLLVKAIKLLRGSFFGSVIAEARLGGPPQLVELAVAKAGLHAIWLRGRRAQVYGLNNKTFRPAIWEDTTRELVPLHATLGRTQASDGDGYREKFYTFEVPAGRYALDLSGLPLAGDVAGLVVQVRETTPTYYGVAGILLCIVSGFLIIGGIVLASLAGEIVNVHN
jgi:hypothetical protein